MIQLTADTISDRLTNIIRQQRQFFQTGKTKTIEFRIAQLKVLRQVIVDRQDQIMGALKADLHKPAYEAYLTEVQVYKEIDYALKHLRSWMNPRSIGMPPEFLPGSAWVQPEPLGVVLIMGAWNYPFQLMISPLIGAIAAGNCVLLKPSEVAPHSSRMLTELIGDTFDPAYITAVEGGIEVSQAILKEKFDHIFFTGGTAIGKIVMAAAATHLTPVTLELGGKSPCIVDQDIHLEHTARRIAWGKFLNAGQTCIAPDYLLVQRRVKPALMEAIAATIQEFYGNDPATSADYARIVSPRHFKRLVEFLKDGRILTGGHSDADTCYIAPTLIDQVTVDAPIMQEEIFGPLLPVLEYEELDEAIAHINAHAKPLALYLFSKNPHVQERVLAETSSGGVCINDTVLQVGISGLPFGGVGDSGIGNYHGKASFDTFSHPKSILRKPFWLELKWRYAPYLGKLEFFKKIAG